MHLPLGMHLNHYSMLQNQQFLMSPGLFRGFPLIAGHTKFIRETLVV